MIRLSILFQYSIELTWIFFVFPIPPFCTLSFSFCRLNLIIFIYVFICLFLWPILNGIRSSYQIFSFPHIFSATKRSIKSSRSPVPSPIFVLWIRISGPKITLSLWKSLRRNELQKVIFILVRFGLQAVFWFYIFCDQSSRSSPFMLKGNA